jgi:hypothetical protein
VLDPQAFAGFDDSVVPIAVLRNPQRAADRMQRPATQAADLQMLMALQAHRGTARIEFDGGLRPLASNPVAGAEAE